METADIIGWIGSLAFALCGIPQAWQCVREGTARGINPLFIALWLTGELCYVASVLMKFGWVGWMMFNYFMNIGAVFVIGYFLVRDRTRRG